VYSTCTFNPVEDEAVIAAVLLTTKRALRLVDVSAHMPALKRVPGLRTWRVRARVGASARAIAALFVWVKSVRECCAAYCSEGRTHATQ
jgi:16S rRNA C967 or C1407 C5-methylase (RsmB/RsmF family)